MSYSILRVAKVKTGNDTRAIQRHNQRENKTYGNTDIDHSKSHLNYDLINETNIQYAEKINERIEEGYQGNRKIRSDAIKLVDGIITSDKEFFDKLSDKEQDKFFKDSLDFIKKEYGEKNVIYATVHRDEKTPHMHFGIVPLTKDGRLSAKDVLGNKKALSELQDRFNDFINNKGFRLERGEKSTGREHIEIMKFKEQTLNKKISSLENEAQSLQKNIEKVQHIDQRIKEVDNFDNKTKRILNQITMNKNDYEAFKSIAKSGIATIQKFEELKKSNIESIQELNSENKKLKKENDFIVSRNQRLLQQNRQLREENSLLKTGIKKYEREINRLRNYLQGFSKNIQIGMKALSEKVKSNALYQAFYSQVFEKSRDIENEKYKKDVENEKQSYEREREEPEKEL